MESTQTAAQYTNDFKKPSWAPPSWVFGPVWTILYFLIALSFGYVGLSFFERHITSTVLAPFILNLIFNISYIFIQFRFRNFILAALDVVLVLATLIWLMVEIYSFAPWVTFINIPYLLWVCFATVLQLSITSLNNV